MQEIRDEHKQQEGDPHVKGRIRQQMRAAARRRMMADVPKADVIVTNPTHYSVALQYNEKKMSAPKVVAKGAGEIALRIRELAAEHRIPVLEAPRWRVRYTDILKLVSTFPARSMPPWPRCWRGSGSRVAGSAKAA